MDCFPTVALILFFLFSCGAIAIAANSRLGSGSGKHSKLDSHIWTSHYVGREKNVTCCTYQYTCAHYQNQKRIFFDSDNEVQWNKNLGIPYYTFRVKQSFVALVRKPSCCFQQTVCVKRNFLPKPVRAKQWK